LAFCALAAATPIRLDEARAAARRNTEALRAELDARRTGEQVVVSKSAIYPRVDLGASASGTASGPQRFFTTVPSMGADGSITYAQEAVDVPGSSRGALSLSLTVSQLLYDGGRWWNQISQSGAQADAAKGQAEEQQLGSELEAVRRFYALYSAQRTLEVLQTTAKDSALQLERANALFEAGRAQKREAIAAEVNLGNDRIAVLRQGQVIASAQVELAVWLTRSGAEELLAQEPPAVAAAPLPLLASDEVLAAARAHRPLYRALEQQLKAADLGVSLAGASYYPQVGVSAAYNRQAAGADPFFTDPVKQNSVQGGVNLSWNLFSGFATDAQVRAAQHARATAELNQSQAQRELEGEVRRVLSALATQLEVVKVAVGNRALAEKGLYLARDRFEAGAGSTLDVRDAQLKLTQAELVALQSRIDVEVARAAVERVMGTQETGEKP
jgi:outer membrane protein TolC